MNDRELASPVRYDAVPAMYFENASSILDIGCGDGQAQRNSVHHEEFIRVQNADEYTGVEIREVYPYLQHIVQSDIRVYYTMRKYDLILMLHILEHIPYRDWKSLLQRVQGWLTPMGVLIVGTPYRQSRKDYGEYRQGGHVTFDIDEKCVQKFLPDLEMFYGHVYPVNRYDGDGVSRIHAFLRHLKRTITRHPYAKQQYSQLLFFGRF